MKDQISSNRSSKASSVPERRAPAGTTVSAACLAVVSVAAAAAAAAGPLNAGLRGLLILTTIISTAGLTALLLSIRSKNTEFAEKENAARLREELERSLRKASLAESNLTAARSEISEFVAMLSHELRTPSNSLLGWSRLLNSSDLDDEMRARALDGIESSVEKQLSVISQLATLKDLNESAGLPLDDEVRFSGLIEDVVEEVRAGAEEASVSLDIVEDIGDLCIRCDKSSFRDALTKLLRAAVSFAPRGSTIRLFARHRGRFLSVNVKSKPGNPDPGTRPDRVPPHRTKGTLTSGRYALPGLSLAISRKIAEMHGGSLSLSGPSADDSAELDLRIPDTLFLH